jgi:hypothetical protein
MARGRGEVQGFTVPAINLRTQVFDMAAAIFRAAAVSRLRGRQHRHRQPTSSASFPTVTNSSDTSARPSSGALNPIRWWRPAGLTISTAGRSARWARRTHRGGASTYPDGSARFDRLRHGDT